MILYADAYGFLLFTSCPLFNGDLATKFMFYISKGLSLIMEDGSFYPAIAVRVNLCNLRCTGKLINFFRVKSH